MTVQLFLKSRKQNIFCLLCTKLSNMLGGIQRSTGRNSHLQVTSDSTRKTRPYIYIATKLIVIPAELRSYLHNAMQVKW